MVDSEAWAHWRDIQESIAHVSDLSLVTYDASGPVSLAKPACEPSRDHPICHLLQEQYGHAASCHAHCGKQIAAAAESNQPIAFTCYAGLHTFAIPVFRDSTYRLVLLGGKRFTTFPEIARLRETADHLHGDLAPLLTQLRQSRLKEPHLLVETARLLEKIGTAFFENISLRTRTESKLGRLLTLFSLFEEIRDEESRRQLFVLILNALGVLFNVRAAAVLAYHPSEETFTTVETFGEQPEGLAASPLNLTDGYFRRFVDQPRPMQCDIVFELLKSGLPESVTSLHLFPLARGKPPASALAIYNTSLTADDISQLGSFCNHLSLMLESQQLRLHLDQHQQKFSALAQFANAVGRTLNSAELFDVIVEQATQLLDADQGSLMVLDDEQQALVIKAIKGIHRKIVDQLKIRPGEGISGKVFASGTPWIVTDVERDQRTMRAKRPRYKTKSFVSLPLQLNGRSIGVLNLTDRASGAPFGEEECALLSAIVTCASVAIERSEYFRQCEELKRISITDALTGFLNRRYFQERMIEEIERSKRHNVSMSLAIMDLDDFKMLNDTYGHQAGDEALKAIARCVHRSIRTIDVAARYGGEEFTIILPQTAKDEALMIAERICQEIAGLTVSHQLLEGYEQLTVSIGLATFPNDAQTPESLLRCADIALYAAKGQGKNRVVAFREE